MMFWLTLLLWLGEPRVDVARSAQAVQQADNGARGVQLLHRAQDAMGGAAKLAAVRDTTHVMDITLERAAGGYKLTQISRFAAPDQFRQEQETPFGRIVVELRLYSRTPEEIVMVLWRITHSVRSANCRKP